METYKTITIFRSGTMYIEHFNTLEAARENFKKAIEDEALTVYLLEEELHWNGNGDSEDRILETYHE